MSEIPLPALQSRLSRLPFGVVGERFALQTQIAALAHGSADLALRNAMLLAAKESAFALLKRPDIRPHYALLAWGVAGALDHDGLLWQLCRLPTKALSTGTRQHRADLPSLAHYGRMLCQVHLLYQAIMLEAPSEEIERTLLEQLHGDPHARRMLQWITGLYRIAAAARDRRDIDTVTQLHANALAALRARRPLEPSAHLDLAALGILAIAKRRRVSRTAFADALPDLPLATKPQLAIA